MTLSAVLPTASSLQNPLPSGGKSWGVQCCFLVLSAMMAVLNTFDAGSSAGRLHIPMTTVGYL